MGGAHASNEFSRRDRVGVQKEKEKEKQEKELEAKQNNTGTL